MISSKVKTSLLLIFNLAPNLKAYCNISLFLFINSENSSGLYFRVSYIFIEVVTLKIDYSDKNKALLTIDNDDNFSLLSSEISDFLSLIKSNRLSMIIFNFENICKIVEISSE